MDTLWKLCKRGSLANVRAVLESGEADVNGRGGHLGRTCLMVAVRRQNLTEEASMDLVTLLLEQPGIELNLTDKRGLTALHLAKSAASVRLLLAAPQPGSPPFNLQHFLASKLHVAYYAADFEGTIVRRARALGACCE